tara:strand:- start:715 stop:1032 length:318 start_codon:yes stop_codon:yes gene_type:complete
MVDEFGENELQKSSEDIKTSSRKKRKAVATGLIVFFLSLSAFGFYVYQNGLFSNLLNVKSTKPITTEGEKNIVEETLAENEISISEENVIQETFTGNKNSEFKNK